MTSMLRVGIDVGGTFTDLVAFDSSKNSLVHVKVLTTPRDPVAGVIQAIELAGLEYKDIAVLVHATTLGTNMFFGQTGIEPPDVVLITNKGFRDILEIGRQNRPELYNLFFEKPRPLVPRSRRLEVRGRIAADGSEVEPLDTKGLEKLVREYCRKGYRIYAVSLLHSYANPSHEETAKKIIEETCPGAIVVTSSDVDPQPIEYERTSTTVVNAVLKPVISRYLEKLVDSLSGKGFTGKILVMQSSGGVAGVEEALEKPAAFIESGPSAGAVAVAYFSKMLGIDKALGFDMGGTTAKASSIIGGEPEITSMYEVGGRVHMGRLIRGSGYPVRYPYIDLAEVSAGGGTIAWVDPGGALRVGPVSAGADPGPACYDRGGTEPTITDANLVLGRLPETIAGGKLRLKKELAVKALSSISEKLGMSLEETAWSILRIANTIMAKALRLVSIERGYDPREFMMFAFGGAGPLHAAEIAMEIGVRDIIIPPMPGVFSALGLLVTDYKHYFIRPVVKRIDELELGVLEDAYRDMEEEADKVLRAEGVSPEHRVYRRYVEAKYWGQAYTLRVPYVGDPDKLAQAFHTLHESRYGFSSPEEPVEIVIAGLEAIGVVEKPVIRLSSIEGVGEAGEARKVYFEDGWMTTSVYSIGSLKPLHEINGPAIIELPDSTIVVPPGSRAWLEETGIIRIRVF